MTPAPDAATKNDLTAIVLGAVGFALLLAILFRLITASSAPNLVPDGSASPEAASTTFYTQSDANLRDCPAPGCSIIGQYPANTALGLPYGSVSDLPDWVPVTWVDESGTSHSGYISKTLLGPNRVGTGDTYTYSSPSTDTSSNQRAPIGARLPDLIKRWSPSVALILCSFGNGNEDFGSGYLSQFPDGSIVVLTNKHVITDEYTGYGANRCEIEIPGDGSYYTVDNSAIKISSDGYDWGVLYVANGDMYFNNTAKKHLPICQQPEETGDSIIVLGYPDYAGQFNNPTATQGIISGYAPPYYTTSAQIESGNSGGVAIDQERGCYVGIPSAVQTGHYANLGRILNADVVFQLSY